MIQLERVFIEQGHFALRDVDLTIDENAYAILLGPTGAGKTTLLEAICGLREISSGKIWAGEVEISSQPPSQRNIGYVPQDLALFPTMTVFEQIAFPLSVRKTSRQQIRDRVNELAALLEIERLLNRKPRGLSGGEKQRVALARALSVRPAMLCLDEPLAALDASTRARMCDVLKNVHDQEQVSILHVTHSLDEAKTLGTMCFQFATNHTNVHQSSAEIIRVDW